MTEEEQDQFAQDTTNEGREEWFEIISQDKDQVLTSLDNLKEQIDIKQGEMENMINKSVTEEWSKMEENLKSRQEARNRDII